MQREYFNYLLLSVLFAVGTGVLIYKCASPSTKGEFSLHAIESNVPYKQEWDVYTSKEQIEVCQNILKQSFYYLGKGSQSFAFESEDGNWVLKFFRHHRIKEYRRPDSPDWNTFDQKTKDRILKKQELINRLFSGYKYGYEKLPQETGLVLLHFKREPMTYQQVIVFNQNGKKEVIDVDQYEFVIQRKASPIKPTLKSLVAEGKIQQAYKRLDQLFDLMRNLALKGCSDLDEVLIDKDNLGFFANSAAIIDLGYVESKKGPCDQSIYQASIAKLKPLREWIEAEASCLLEYFDFKMAHAMHNYPAQ